MSITARPVAGPLGDDGSAGAEIDALPQRWGGLAKLVREGLGLSAFGVQIMDLAPGYATGAHDERDTGQEELYVALSGSGAVVRHRETGDERLALDPDRIVAVGPAVARTLQAGPAGVRVLCVGAAPGRPYAPPEWTAGFGG